MAKPNIPITQFVERLYNFQRPSRWSAGIGAELPEAYKKFWREWKIQKPAPIHYIPKQGKYEMVNGQLQPVQNVPLPLKYPKELDKGLWGGEAVIIGFVKRRQKCRRIPHYWVPQIFKSVVYSEILNKYMRMNVTQRAMDLIHENYGFDNYILKTPACELRSELAVKLKQKLLMSLADNTLYPEDPVKRKEVYSKYEKFLEPYTREDIEWYGLNYHEACKKHINLKLAAYKPIPLKVQYRADLINELKQEKEESFREPESWLSKINPFKKTTTINTSADS